MEIEKYGAMANGPSNNGSEIIEISVSESTTRSPRPLTAPSLESPPSDLLPSQNLSFPRSHFQSLFKFAKWLQQKLKPTQVFTKLTAPNVLSECDPETRALLHKLMRLKIFNRLAQMPDDSGSSDFDIIDQIRNSTKLLEIKKKFQNQVTQKRNKL